MSISEREKAALRKDEAAKERISRTSPHAYLGSMRARRRTIARSMIAK
jgi:hypothetical protein